MSHPRLNRRTQIAALCLMMMSVSVPAVATEAAPAVATPKQINIIVGMPPGGGVDAYARLLQRHITKHLSQTPSIVVQNMPGAGSLRSVMALANTVQNPEPSIATFSSSLLTEAITDPDKVRVNFRDFAFLGNVAEDSRVCFVSKRSGITRLEDLKARGAMTFGATAPGTSGNLDTAILQKLLGVKLNLVLGYSGSAEKRLALERGEIDGDCAGATSLPEDWLKEGKIKVLVRFSETLPPGIDPSVPFAGALITDPDLRKMYDFLVTPQQLGRLFMVSRKLSPSIVTALRKAFDASVKDPEFIADATKLGLLVTPTSGVEVDRHVARMYETSPTLLERAKSIVKD